MNLTNCKYTTKKEISKIISFLNNLYTLPPPPSLVAISLLQDSSFLKINRSKKYCIVYTNKRPVGHIT